jgi:hypothetical protein
MSSLLPKAYQKYSQTHVRDWSALEGTSLDAALFNQWVREKNEQVSKLIKVQPFY